MNRVIKRYLKKCYINEIWKWGWFVIFSPILRRKDELLDENNYKIITKMIYWHIVFTQISLILVNTFYFYFKDIFFPNNSPRCINKIHRWGRFLLFSQLYTEKTCYWMKMITKKIFQKTVSSTYLIYTPRWINKHFLFR